MLQGRGELKVFAGRGSRDLATSVCDYLDIRVGQGTTELFPDGEVIVRVDEDVRGRDCYVVQSTYHPVNAHLMELLIYIDCLKRASAARVTAVIPYFGYARQDRKDSGRVPITAKLVANLIATAGADRVVAMDLHAPQIQGFFDLPVDHLMALPVFSKHFEDMKGRDPKPVIVSPDVGNVKIASLFANVLNADIAIVDKRRQSGTEVVSANLIGDVEGRTVLMFDDMITTAGTMCSAAELVVEKGASEVMVACSHAVLAGLAIERLEKAPISKIFVTDSIPCGDRTKKIESKLEVLSVAELIGEAIRRIHLDQSVSTLLKTQNVDSV